MLAIPLLLAACASTPQTRSLLAGQPPDIPDRDILADVPFFPQSRYQCGPAALATVLSVTQLEVTPEELVPLVYVPERTGSFQTEVTATARSYGRLAYQIPGTLEDLLREIVAGHPVLVLQNLGLAHLPQWHFAVAKGFDLVQEQLILNSGEIEDYRLSLPVFERTWARSGYWGLVVVRPGQLPATAQPGPYFQAMADLQHSYPNFTALQAGYESALQRWGGDRDLLMGLGNVLLEQHKLTDAAMAFTQVVTRYPDYGPGHNNLSQTLLEQGNFAQALAHINAAINLQDDFVHTYQRTLSEIQRRQNTAGQ